jgi:hypothetical protein
VKSADARTALLPLQLRGRLRQIAGSDILVGRGKLLDLAFVPLRAILLPPDKAAARGEEQHHRCDNPGAIPLEEAAHLIAPEVLVDLANESVSDVRGLRQRRSSVGSVGVLTPVASLPHPR